MKHDEISSLLPLYLDGNLPPDQLAAIEEHLSTCDSCRNEMREHRLLRTLESTIARREYAPPAELIADVMLRIEAEPQRLGHRLRELFDARILLPLTTAAVAAVLALTIGRGNIEQLQREYRSLVHDQVTDESAERSAPAAQPTTRANPESLTLHWAPPSSSSADARISEALSSITADSAASVSSSASEDGLVGLFYKPTEKAPSHSHAAAETTPLADAYVTSDSHAGSTREIDISDLVVPDYQKKNNRRAEHRLSHSRKSVLRGAATPSTTPSAAMETGVVGTQALKSTDAAVPVNALTSMIPPGQRAVTLDVDATSGIEGYADPSSKVDVIWTTRDAKTGQVQSRVIAQNLTVLSASAASANSGPRTSGTDVTLLTSATDAAKLQLARQTGQLTLTLRSGAANTAQDISVSALAASPGTYPSAPQGVVRLRDPQGNLREYWVRDGKLIDCSASPHGCTSNAGSYYYQPSPPPIWNAPQEVYGEYEENDLYSGERFASLHL